MTKSDDSTSDISSTVIRLTSLKYSPMSACLNVVIPVGSSRLASAVDRAVTPNP